MFCPRVRSLDLEKIRVNHLAPSKISFAFFLAKLFDSKLIQILNIFRGSEKNWVKMFTGKKSFAKKMILSDWKFFWGLCILMFSLLMKQKLILRIFHFCVIFGLNVI
jgi:hypothetical protein